MTNRKQRKVRRKYSIKDKFMISEIAKLIRDTPRSEINLRLDEYERDAIKFPSKWVKESPLEEVAVILTKLGHPVCISINDERNPLKAFEIMKASKEFHRTGKLDKLIELVQNHNYFCMTGAQIMRQQDLYSHLVGGTVFKANPNYRLFLNAALSKNPKDQKAVDEFILNILSKNEIGEFNLTDWKIIFLIRRFDEAPVSTLTIQDMLSFTDDAGTIQRHLTRLTKFGYIQKFGLRKLSSYILTGKAWQEMTRFKNECFKGIRFIEDGYSVEILKEISLNGTTVSSEARKEHIA